MSDKPNSAARKGGKARKLIIITAGVLLLGVGGTATGLYVAGALPGQSSASHEDYDRPRLVLKGEDPEAIAAEFSGKSPKGENASKKKPTQLPAPQDPSRYQATYFQISAPLTSNLSDSDAFAQISLAVSTYYDSRVIAAVQQHEMAIRSALLLMLAEQSELALTTPAGKEGLQVAMTRTINNVLKQKSGYDGVDNVYFTNFVIQ